MRRKQDVPYELQGLSIFPFRSRIGIRRCNRAECIPWRRCAAAVHHIPPESAPLSSSSAPKDVTVVEVDADLASDRVDVDVASDAEVEWDVEGDVRECGEPDPHVLESGQRLDGSV